MSRAHVISGKLSRTLPWALCSLLAAWPPGPAVAGPRVTTTTGTSGIAPAAEIRGSAQCPSVSGAPPRGLGAAHDLLSCLSGNVRQLLSPSAPRPALGAPGDYLLEADRLVLVAPVLDNVAEGGQMVLRCRASRVEAEGVSLSRPGESGRPGLTMAFDRLVLDGPLEVRFAQIDGRLLGLLPVSLGALPVPTPPLPLGWVEMADVRMTGLSLRTASAEAVGMRQGADPGE